MCETVITIPLTGKHGRGMAAKVCACDAHLAKLPWHARPASTGALYAVRSGNVYLHMEVLTPKPGFTIDHRNRDTLDCRRSNLRHATKREQARNRGKRRDGDCPYPGVGRHKTTGRWRARIVHEGKRIALGMFDTPEEAWEARKEAEDRLWRD